MMVVVSWQQQEEQTFQMNINKYEYEMRKQISDHVCDGWQGGEKEGSVREEVDGGGHLQHNAGLGCDHV